MTTETTPDTPAVDAPPTAWMDDQHQLTDAGRRAMLRSVPGTYADPSPDRLSKLPKPTRKDNPKGRCDDCGGWHGLPAMHLDYEGHADVTLDLIAVDPEWSWEPGWITANGDPVDPFAFGNDQLLARMTVLGVTRPCVGSIPSDKVGTESWMKELTGDMIRNGAMRFGIGTGLWSTAQREGHDPDAASAPDPEAEARKAATEAQEWPLDTMRVKARQLADLFVASTADPAPDVEVNKQLTRAMWDEVVGAVDGDHVFRGLEVNQTVEDFNTWLGRYGADRLAELVPRTPELDGIAPDGTDTSHGGQT